MSASLDRVAVLGGDGNSPGQGSRRPKRSRQCTKEVPDQSSGWSLAPKDQIQLAEGIKRGETAAEDTFVRTFHGPVLTLLSARTRDAESARDLTQDALFGSLIALRQGRLRQTGKMAAFVAGVARNTALKFLRARRTASLPLDEATESSLPGCDVWPETDERRILISAALQELEGSERAVLDLTWRENLAPRQIAQRLKVTSEVVRSRKSRALKKVLEYVRSRGPAASRRR